MTILTRWPHLPEIRRLIFEGKQKEAEKLANKAIITKKSHGQMFQPAGELHLTFPPHDNYQNYYRELDIARAVAKTTYKVNGVTFTREVLASFPDQVIVIRLTASKPGQLSFAASYSTLHSKPDDRDHAGEGADPFRHWFRP
jgi:alpha-L-fucosidase 2